MKGIIFSDPAVGAEYRTDLPMPVCGENDVLVKVSATAICGTDQHIYRWTPWAQARIPFPMVFGHEFAGTIVETGSRVKFFKPSDRVAGETHIPCNNCYMCAADRRHNCAHMKIIGVHVPGSFAEYIAFPQDCAFPLGDEISDRQGCMLEPMGVAVHGVSVAQVENQTVVIYGAGPIGLMAVGAARAMKAARVICIDVFSRKLAVAQTMGADLIVNGAQIDPVQTVLDATGGVGADVVIDYTGSPKAIASGFDMLRKNGRFVVVGLPSQEVSLDWCNAIIYKEATVIGVTGRLMYQTWQECMQILRSPQFSLEPVTGGVYPMADFRSAFEAIQNGAPGKMILIP